MARHAHPVAVVAKTRDQPRGIVMDAIAVGLRPAIYGTGWEEFVDPSLVVAPYVPNDELPAVYSSVGVLLNDHWPSMREWGFVSNRLFDALACGTAVVSDPLPELEELFGGAVASYEQPEDLLRLVRELANAGDEVRTLIDRARRAVLDRHTFDARAESVLRLLADLGSPRAAST
jgi:spore maturation protein CgeB